MGERGTGDFCPASTAPIPAFAAWRRIRAILSFLKVIHMIIVLIETAALECEVRNADGSYKLMAHSQSPPCERHCGVNLSAMLNLEAAGGSLDIDSNGGA